MRTARTLMAGLLLSVAAFAADTFHVTAIHNATRDDEKTYRPGFSQNTITGTVEEVH